MDGWLGDGAVYGEGSSHYFLVQLVVGCVCVCVCKGWLIGSAHSPRMSSSPLSSPQKQQRLKGARAGAEKKKE